MKRQYTPAFRVGLLAALAPALVLAQDAELSPRAPNVLLVVDTSGSMEYKVGIDDTTHKPEFPACNPGSNAVGANEKSRWIDLIEVLTGTINDYRCQAIDRSSSAFADEYDLPGPLRPIDYRYRNPYHRPVSGSCVLGPNTAGAAALSNAFDWVEPVPRDYSSSGACSGAGFLQSDNGIIDNFGDFVRFGLMTFDTLPHRGTGYDASYGPDWPSGKEGGFSYFFGTTPSRGNPADCATEDMEVGARNAAALPWEGKLIPFGAADLLDSENENRHEHIKKVLLTTRPYGATPLAGILEDARTFLLRDDTNVSFYVGPQADPYVTDGCRKQTIIVLTDGEPNLDLRPECAAAAIDSTLPGVCPFGTPEETADDLYTNEGIKTYVIGFSPSDVGSSLDCSTLTTSDFAVAGSGACADQSNRELQACCNMHRLAYMGGTERALLATDSASLRSRMNEILNEVVGGQARSRTRPTWARSGPNTGEAPSASFRFLSALEVTAGVWRGKLERQRYTCNGTTFVPEAAPIEISRGDDFVANLNSADGKMSRRFYTFVSTDTGYDSERSVRPALSGADPDGLGLQTGELVTGTITDFVSQVPASNMKVNRNASDCQTGTDDACRDKVLRWTIGDSDGDPETEDRCPTPGSDCNLMGDIQHSTPRVVDHPDAIIQDETYDAFATLHTGRPQVLYTSSNDGFFHAFKVRPNTTDTSDRPVDSNNNNELWSFIPPAVLTRLQDQYPNSHERLLDGEPIVKDVVATTDSGGVVRFERSVASAAAAENSWRTVLVQSFGAAWPGYFALDITDPVAGPRFLWQLTTVGTGEPLFGLGGTPLITTVFDGSKEIAVAVLPGGNAVATTSTTPVARALPGPLDQLEDEYEPRPSVREYPAAPSVAATARSLTIVRLDTGEILRSFRFDDTTLPDAVTAGGGAGSALRARITQTPLDSPVTGRPVAFPADVGAVADRIFVGDKDGTLWRVDVSANDPEDWTMDLFFDTFALHASEADGGASRGQPISTPPILSVDELGRITVNVSTGDQEAIDVPGTTNYLWSLTEELNADGSFRTLVNWYKRWDDGTRITGPMVLLQSDLYFAAFTPSTTSACGGGTSSIAGYDYVLPDNTTGGIDNGGIPVRTPAGTTFGITGISGAVFGVTVGQEATCNSETGDFSSPYLGYGSQPATSMTPGGLKLMYQTSDTTQQDSTGGQIGAGSVSLRRPPSVARISSWTALID